MKMIARINKQISDTEKMIETTNTLLINNAEDNVLTFMLAQDQALLQELKIQRTKATLEYLKTIDNSAERLLKDIYDDFIFEVDPFFIANSLGIKIIKNDNMEHNEAGKCYINNEIVIEYKPQYSHNRERFSVAHELAHIIKHMSYINNTHFEDSENLLYARNNYIDSANKEEQEADQLAGELLMPKSTINYLIGSLSPLESLSTKMLQDIFKVSEGSVYYALKYYGLLDHPKIKKEFSWL